MTIKQEGLIEKIKSKELAYEKSIIPVYAIGIGYRRV